MSFSIDAYALREAERDLGLTLPCRVLLGDLDSIMCYGIYDGIDPLHPAHMIRISTHSMMPNATLWHELCHAQQCERLGDWHRFNTLYHEQVTQVMDECPPLASYETLIRAKMSIPFEVEADHMGALALDGQLPILILSDQPARLEIPTTKMEGQWTITE